jgi:hypothetical protein
MSIQLKTHEDEQRCGLGPGMDIGDGSDADHSSILPRTVWQGVDERAATEEDALAGSWMGTAQRLG